MYSIGKRPKRSVDCIEIVNPGPDNNQSVPLYKIYESGNNSKDRIENIIPESLSNMFTVDMNMTESDGNRHILSEGNRNVSDVKDDYAERSISENLQSQVHETVESSKKDAQSQSANDSVNTNSKSSTNENIPDSVDFRLNYGDDDDENEDNNSEEEEDSLDDNVIGSKLDQDESNNKSKHK